MPLAALIPGLVQAGIGIAQSIGGAVRAKKARKQLEGLVDSYQPNQSIMDYYNKALQRYNVNPYTSSLYNYQQGQIKGSTAQGIQALQDRKSALAGIPNIIQRQNDSLLKAAAVSEGQQGQALGQLGAATALKDREDKYKFEAKYNILSNKAAGGAAQTNAGTSNLFGGVGGLSNYFMASQMFGNNGGAGGGSGQNYDYFNNNDLFRYRGTNPRYSG